LFCIVDCDEPDIMPDCCVLVCELVEGVVDQVPEVEPAAEPDAEPERLPEALPVRLVLVPSEELRSVEFVDDVPLVEDVPGCIVLELLMPLEVEGVRSEELLELEGEERFEDEPVVDPESPDEEEPDEEVEGV
jgi:hypothetical protein